VEWQQRTSIKNCGFKKGINNNYMNFILIILGVVNILFLFCPLIVRVLHAPNKPPKWMIIISWVLFALAALLALGFLGIIVLFVLCNIPPGNCAM
jgi:hypothetical protein